MYLKANGIRQRRDVLSSGSYISANDRRLKFGLGDATDAGTAEIHWPSGAKETIKLPAVDRIFTIKEGKGITGAMCGGSLAKPRPQRPPQPRSEDKQGPIPLAGESDCSFAGNPCLEHPCQKAFGWCSLCI